MHFVLPRTFRLRAVCGALAAWAALGAAPPARAAVDAAALSLEQLMELPVVGASKYRQRQRDVAAAVVVVTREEIRTFGWRTLAEVLATLPGIYLSHDRQYTYAGLRGYGFPGDYNTRLLLTLDGQRLNDPVYDAALIGREFPLDLALVERIEYIPGPGGAVYGQNAMLGVVNVVTRRGADVAGAEVAVAAQARPTAAEGRATWGRRTADGTDLLLSVSGWRSRGLDLDLAFPGAGPGGSTLEGTARGMDGERDREFYARAATGPWTFAFIYGERRRDDPTGIYFSDPLVPGQYEQDRHVVGQVRYERTLPSGADLLATMSLGQYRYTGDLCYAGVMRPSTSYGEWWTGEARVVQRVGTAHTVMAGVEVQVNGRTDQAFEDGLDGAQSVFVPDSSTRAGVYLQDEWRLGEGLVATLGLRLDHSSVTGLAMNPRAGLLWEATPATLVKALVGRAGRAPNSFERVWDDAVSQVANLSLGAERVDTLEVVVDHRAAPDLALRASVYRWRIADPIILGLDPASGLTQFQAGPHVTSNGVELSLDKTWAGGARLRANAAWQQARDADGAALPNAPRLLGNLLVSAPLPAGLRVGYELHAQGARRTLAGERSGGYALSSLTLGAQGWLPGLDLTLKIRNLFDKRYVHPASDVNWQDTLPQDGRSVALEAQWRY